jgi:hypothetical protein
MTSSILLLLLSLATAAASKNATANNFLQGQNFLGHGINIIFSNPLVGANNNGGAPEGLTKVQSVIEFAPSENTVKCVSPLRPHLPAPPHSPPLQVERERQQLPRRRRL